MTTYKVAELAGELLDAAVAKAFELDYTLYRDDRGTPYMVCSGRSEWSPSTNWTQGGPILETEHLVVYQVPMSDGTYAEWYACDAQQIEEPRPPWKGEGPTLLIAAMRAIVARSFGDTVEIDQ